jgi:Nucleotidyl transferase AbiEii toxin, Type IV TA system
MAELSGGSRKWPTSDWPVLLRNAIGLIDTLEADVPWSFGGGTALAVHYRHRLSYDIDIFFANADAVTALSPNQNPDTKALLAGRKYEFPGNYLKLKLDQGEIDFVVGSKRTSDPTQAWSFEGRTIQIETPWEIAVKKLFYRPSTFKVRDIFDLAVVIDHDAERLDPFISVVADRLDKAIDRISAIAPSYEALALHEVNPTQDGQRYGHKAAVESVLTFLAGWTDRHPT